jgi:uncharacterized protein (DUF4415 family)
MPNAKNKKGYSARDLREVSDNPKWTKEDFAKARPFVEVFPELAASIRRGRGPNKAPTKTLVSLRLSGQVIEAYRPRGRAGNRGSMRICGGSTRSSDERHRIFSVVLKSRPIPSNASGNI